MADLMVEASHAHTEDVTVLVVSDDLYNVFALQRRLESRRYNVLTSTSQGAAIETARERLPDLMLIDVTRDRLDGFAVKEALNELPETAEIPVVFLSNRNRIDFVVQAYELGAEGLLAKPFHLEELFARASVIVRRRIRQKKLAEEIERLVDQVETGGVAIEDEDEMRSRLDQSIEKADRRREPISCLHLKVTGLYELNNPPLSRQILMDIGVVTDVKIAGTLAKQLDIPFIRLGNINIPDTIIAMVPPEVAEKYLAIPIIANHNKLVVAMADPLEQDAKRDLHVITQMSIRVAVSPRRDITEALQRYYPKR